MPPAKPAEPAEARPATAEADPKPKVTTRLWLALANLSISRTATKDGERMADIVHRGETVTLTDDQANGFLTRHRVPVIRPAKDQNDPAPAIRARDLFGERPRAEQFGARPDPPGASRGEVTDPADPRNAPEATDPKTDFSVDPDAAKDR
jgi:hypothetical protein